MKFHENCPPRNEELVCAKSKLSCTSLRCFFIYRFLCLPDIDHLKALARDRLPNFRPYHRLAAYAFCYRFVMSHSSITHSYDFAVPYLIGVRYFFSFSESKYLRTAYFPVFTCRSLHFDLVLAFRLLPFPALSLYLQHFIRKHCLQIQDWGCIDFLVIDLPLKIFADNYDCVAFAEPNYLSIVNRGLQQSAFLACLW